jgi:PAS domain S-box-containing protein
LAVPDEVGTDCLAEFGIGVVHLNAAGEIVGQNEAAARLLDGIVKGRLATTLSDLVAQARRALSAVSGIIEGGPWGAVRLQVRAVPAGFVLLLEQSYEERLRTEGDILRGLLAAARRPTSPAEALGPALAGLARALGRPDLALFAVNPAGSTAHCVVAVGKRLPTSYLKSHAIGPWTSVVGRALFTQGIVHVAHPGRGPFAAERDLGLDADCAMLALPVRVRDTTGGVLLIAGQGEALHAGAMRLALGLADAFGTLLERTLRDQQLDVEQTRRRELLEQLPEAILEVDEGGLIREAAGRVAAVLGRSATEVVGHAALELVGPDDVGALTAMLGAAEGGSLEVDLVRPDGQTTTCKLAIAPKGNPRLVVVRDVTAERRAQDELENARRVAITQDRRAALGQLLSCITHEINNPLSYVKSNVGSLPKYLEHLQAETPNSEPWRQLVTDVNDSVVDALDGIERIIKIVRALKGMSRQESTERVTFDPAGPIRDAVVAFQGAQRAHCTVDLSLDDLPPADGSPAAVGQVILNLLENALDACGGKGRVSVEAHANSQGTVLRVTDEGSGIPEGLRRHIFQPYFTTKPIGKGTGLGLYICHELIAQMGGTINFETSPSGTTFVVELPAKI